MSFAISKTNRQHLVWVKLVIIIIRLQTVSVYSRPKRIKLVLKLKLGSKTNNWDNKSVDGLFILSKAFYSILMAWKVHMVRSEIQIWTYDFALALFSN